MSARTAPRPLPCPHTAALADAAAADLAAIVEQLGELIGGGNQASNALNGMRAVLARAGAMVDMVAKAHGAAGWDHDALRWMFNDGQRQALLALEPVAVAAAEAGRDRAAAALGTDNRGEA